MTGSSSLCPFIISFFKSFFPQLVHQMSTLLPAAGSSRFSLLSRGPVCDLFILSAHWVPGTHPGSTQDFGNAALCRWRVSREGEDSLDGQ